MENKLVQIVQEFVEQILNAKRFDRIYDYFSEQCVFYSPPYVGMGFLIDDSSGERLVVKSVAANGPAAGRVQVGDVLLRARDIYGSYEGYDPLRMGVWGQGKLGTEMTLTLLRDGESIEVTIVRGRVESFHTTMAEVRDIWKHTLLEEIPDLHTEINQILASGDMVAYFATNTATNNIYHQSAIWTECNILRLEKGKIVESWGLEDSLSYWRQLGLRTIMPEKEMA